MKLNINTKDIPAIDFFIVSGYVVYASWEMNNYSFSPDKIG